MSLLLELFVFIILVEVFFFDDVQFDGIESNYFQLSSTLFARNCVALVRVRINMDIGIAIGACSGRHFVLPPSQMVDRTERGTAPVCLIGEAPTLFFCNDRDNLTARGGFCNTDLEKIGRADAQALKP